MLRSPKDRHKLPICSDPLDSSNHVALAASLERAGQAGDLAALAHMYVYIYIYIYTHTHVCIICVYNIYIYIYIYTHANKRAGQAGEFAALARESRAPASAREAA